MAPQARTSKGPAAHARHRLLPVRRARRSAHLPRRDGRWAGGLGPNAIRDAHQVELYIDSVEKLRSMVTRREAPVEVHLTTHPFATGLMEQRPALASHVPGTPHPLVDRASLLLQLDALERAAKERLALANAKIQAKSTKP